MSDRGCLQSISLLDKFSFVMISMKWIYLPVVYVILASDFSVGHDRIYLPVVSVIFASDFSVGRKLRTLRVWLFSCALVENRY